MLIRSSMLLIRQNPREVVQSQVLLLMKPGGQDMFDYVDKIINAFDKAEPKGGGTKSSAAPDETWWPRHYTPPNEPDPIHAQLLCS
jgi:hypothetical protein